MNTNIKEIINGAVCECMHKKEINENSLTPEMLLSELGFDSLDVMEIIMRVENAIGVSIPNEKIHNIYTLKDIYSLFEKAA